MKYGKTPTRLQALVTFFERLALVALGATLFGPAWLIWVNVVLIAVFIISVELSIKITKPKDEP